MGRSVPISIGATLGGFPWSWPLQDHKQPLSFPGLLSAIDPKRSISFLQTGQSATFRFCERECSKPALGDFTLPAMNGREKHLPKAVIGAG